NRVTDDAGAHLELPENFSAPGIDCLEPAIECPIEHDAARGRQRATPDWIRLPDSPDFLSGRCIPGYELPAITARSTLLRRIAADERRARDVSDRARLKVHAEIVRGNVEQP